MLRKLGQASRGTWSASNHLAAGSEAVGACMKNPHKNMCTAANDQILLRGLKFFGYHGVLQKETETGQNFFVDATLRLDVRGASQNDDLEQTVNYAEVYRDIKNIVEGEPQQLIETVAEAVAYTILRQHPRVETAVVRVDKPDAPIDGTFGTVAVEVTRSRHSLD